MIHSFSDDLLGHIDGVGLANLLRKGELSVSEVVTTVEERLEKVEPSLCSTEPYKKPSTDIRKASVSGAFAGVPIFIKDNIDLLGYPTGQGTKAVSKPPIAKKNDPYIDQLLSLGFIPLGKSRMPEFGLNASTEFVNEEPTRNPWNPNYSAGASSGGAAALVSSGVVPIAHANDGGGSIRIPAACCGIVGLKPSRGRHVLSLASKALPLDILSQGVLSRTVRDTAYFIHESEKYYRNESMPAVGLVEGPDTRPLRIGMITESFSAQSTDRETLQTLLRTAKTLEGMGHNIEEIALPSTERFVEDFGLYWGFLAFSVTNFGKAMFGRSFDSSKLDDFTRGLSRMFAKKIYKAPLLFRRLRKSIGQMDDLFQKYDVVLSPVLSHTTPKLGFLSPEQNFSELFEKLMNYSGFTPLNNITGTPAISLPLGRTTNGLPIGIQLAGRLGQESTLLKVSYALEEAMPWANHFPRS